MTRTETDEIPADAKIEPPRLLHLRCCQVAMLPGGMCGVAPGNRNASVTKWRSPLATEPDIDLCVLCVDILNGGHLLECAMDSPAMIERYGPA